MRVALSLLVLATIVRAGGAGYGLLGIRDDPRQVADTSPPRTVLSVDVLSATKVVDTRRIVIRDPRMRRILFRDPFLVPVRPDLAYLVCTEENGVRCLRISWTAQSDVGNSFAIHCTPPAAWRSRPRHVGAERVGVLTSAGLLTLDLRLATSTATHVRARPLDYGVALNRLYVAGAQRIDFHAVAATNAPRAITRAPQPLLRLPDRTLAERAFVRSDGVRVAYASIHPSRRLAGYRFLLSVADSRERLLVRRSVPGALHDLRWIDDDRVLFTTLDEGRTAVHVLAVGEDALETTRLPARYLAPPEIVPATLVGLGGS